MSHNHLSFDRDLFTSPLSYAHVVMANPSINTTPTGPNSSQNVQTQNINNNSYGSTIDNNSHPLFLHNNDQPGMVLISKKVTGSENYAS